MSTSTATFRSPAETAAMLRAFLMDLPPGACCPARVPSGLVDVRAAAPGLLPLPAPPWSAADTRFLVRPEVADRLHRAACVLPSNLRIGFWEGLRPLPVQRTLWDSGLRFFRTAHATLSPRELELALEPYVARPDGPTPPHSTGSAVDVAPVDAWGRVLGPGDAWGKMAVDAVSHALRGVGLASYEAEWWHWSYGDDEWARAYDCAPLPFPAWPEFDGPGGGI
jgi:D-alanyl-D-alanine dipeptidase